MSDAPHLLVIDAPYYADISKNLMQGVKAAFSEVNATFDYVTVPGVLEIPAAVSIALSSGKTYDGFVVIGCVIRGETTHYEIVSNESARALMDLAVEYRLALGNGIQTVENKAQALARAKVSDKNKGGGAARAALAMIALKKELG